VACYAPGLIVGPVFGLERAARLGVVLVLSLRRDNTFWPVLLPVNGPPALAEEASCRCALVTAHRRPALLRPGAVGVVVHDFVSAPVMPELCARCSYPALNHDQAKREQAVARALDPSLEVQVSFKWGTLDVADVQVRARRARAALCPVPDEQGEVAVAPEVPGRAAWRPLTDAERGHVRYLASMEVPEAVQEQASPPQEPAAGQEEEQRP
jgi:hypothetical protein